MTSTAEPSTPDRRPQALVARRPPAPAPRGTTLTHLGPVGGRIVGEVFYGLIEGDSQSYLTQDPEWTPTYGVGHTFEMTHLLTKAGVVGAL